MDELRQPRFMSSVLSANLETTILSGRDEHGRPASASCTVAFVRGLNMKPTPKRAQILDCPRAAWPLAYAKLLRVEGDALPALRVMFRARMRLHARLAVAIGREDENACSALLAEIARPI